MFGYVTPCIMELKVKDYEKFKAYYCGLCKSIKNNIGNIPRCAINYDMTFLGILLYSLNDEEAIYRKETCILHPVKKRLVVQDNKALSYASFCNIALTSYKLLDNVNDDKSIKSKLYYLFLNNYLKKFPDEMKESMLVIESKLSEIYNIEKSIKTSSLDELSHPFGELTAFLLSNYEKDGQYVKELSTLGYNLGKWIYIIDAYDDLKEDMEKGKFNALCKIYNKDNLNFDDFYSSISDRMEFILTNCGRQCLDSLNKLPLIKNQELLENILHFGIIEKMDNIFKRSCSQHEQSL